MFYSRFETKEGREREEKEIGRGGEKESAKEKGKGKNM